MNHPFLKYSYPLMKYPQRQEQFFSVKDKNFYRKKNKNINFEYANHAGGTTQGIMQHENFFRNFQSRYIAFPNSKIYHLS